MAFKFSTGLRNHLLDGNSLKNALDGGFIHIYSGTMPASADDAITGTLLATIYSDGEAAGLGFGSADNGVLFKDPGETWDNSDSGNIVGGAATHFLFVAAAEDDGDSIGSSTTAPRILGTVGGPGADLVLSNTTLTQGNTQVINSFFVAIPESI